MCGGDLEILENATVCECIYCGLRQAIPPVKTEDFTNLFNRANKLRIKCEFDKAEEIYEKILAKDDTLAEAYWGLVLCKYGIEYVEDPETKKQVPTCHRTSYESVTSSGDYLSAIEYADIDQKILYKDEAKIIENIQKKTLEIVKNEKPFDVFICYKESDVNGKRTVDSTYANDIYHELTSEGFKVFFAPITLEEKLGQEYEPYIFAALNSAKVMLVIGSEEEYFNSVWVKNEWSRFLKIMKTDRSKLLIPCYKDIDPYDLPEEFAHLQAQDMGKIGFITDIVRGIKKVIKTEEDNVPSSSSSTTAATTIIQNSTEPVEPLLKRAFLFLEDGDFTNAYEYCEKVLDRDPENARAYLGKTLVAFNLKRGEELSKCGEEFFNNKDYLKAVRFADDEFKAELDGYLSEYKENKYNFAFELMENAQTENDFNNAAETFKKLAEYKDSNELATKCLEESERLSSFNDEYERLNNELNEKRNLRMNKESQCQQLTSKYYSDRKNLGDLKNKFFLVPLLITMFGSAISWVVFFFLFTSTTPEEEMTTLEAFIGFFSILGIFFFNVAFIVVWVINCTKVFKDSFLEIARRLFIILFVPFASYIVGFYDCKKIIDLRKDTAVLENQIQATTNLLNQHNVEIKALDSEIQQLSEQIKRMNISDFQ